jgi:phosphate:Na+ symporter
MAPEVALQQADLEMDNMVEITREMFEVTREYVNGEKHDKKLYERINHLEDITDNIEEEMIKFITLVLTGSVSRTQSSRGYGLIRMADEIESIADSLQSFAIYRSRLYKRKEDISAEAWADIMEFYDRVGNYFDRLTAARENELRTPEIRGLIQDGTPLTRLADQMRDRHLERIRTGACQSVTAQTYSDMFVSLRHIKNHAINYVEAYAGI